MRKYAERLFKGRIRGLGVLCVALVASAMASLSIRGQERIRTDILVIGGGTGGTSAGIQAARMGIKTIIAEPGPWLGGMLSAAGISATDGNHAMPSGIWGEFRDRMYKVYGGAGKVATGWVSNTQFEPHVADSILKSMCRAIPSLDVRHGLQFVRAITNGHLIEGAVFIDLHTGKQVEVIALQTIDATELGDVMASAGVPFDLGMEASSQTGENLDIPESNPIIQDLTYAAILKDYGPTADCTLIKPNGYDPREFDCCCTDNCSDSMKLFSKVNRQTMLNYGRLPNGKYLLNWPSHGNDMYLDIVSMDENARAIALQGAKQKTLRFIYHIQTALGFKNLGLADDEFPTGDRLPLIPYHREGRRLKGIVRFKVQHIARPFEDSSALYRTGISVGDYPIDQHHRENPAAPQHLGYYPVPSFNIPLGALIPARHDGLIVAEKGISVSNAANGTTRLQPVVMLTGQAAGALAATAVMQKKHARHVPVRTVQAALLESGAYLMPFFDVGPGHPAFRSIQRIGATGILKGKGEPFQWENRTWFFPDAPVNRRELTIDIAPFFPLNGPGNGQLTIGDAIQLADQFGSMYQISFQSADMQGRNRDDYWQDRWQAWGLRSFDAKRFITRAEFSVLMDKTVDPFSLMGVDHHGRLKTARDVDEH